MYDTVSTKYKDPHIGHSPICPHNSQDFSIYMYDTVSTKYKDPHIGHSPICPHNSQDFSIYMYDTVKHKVQRSPYRSLTYLST